MVERHVANVNVVSSNLIARFFRGVRLGFVSAVQDRKRWEAGGFVPGSPEATPRQVGFVWVRFGFVFLTSDFLKSL